MLNIIYLVYIYCTIKILQPYYCNSLQLQASYGMLGELYMLYALHAVYNQI